MENFRTPNFELVSDLLYWMVKKYDPRASVTEEIDTEDDRVEFLTQVATEVLAKARIRLHPKRLYAADGFAVKELLKVARILYDASRIDLMAGPEAEDEDEKSGVHSLLGARVKDVKGTRQLASEITQSGAKVSDLLQAELDVRDARHHAIRFLDAWSLNHESSSEQKYLERRIQDLLVTLQESVEVTERQVVELDAEEKALSAKNQKAQLDLERSEKRLKSLQHVRPAFMDEYEKLETELERQYAIYCERFRNLDYLQRELELHTSRELKQLAENDRSLKKLQKKFRDDELAILRGEQDDEVEPTRRHGDHRTQMSVAMSNQRHGSATNGVDEASSDDSSGSGSSDEEDSSDASLERPSRTDKAGPSSSESDQVSLADSGELIDNDDDVSSDVSGSGDSGSDTNSDSDQDF